MRLFRKLSALVFLAALLFLFPCLAENGETRILVIETTDIHGYIMDASSGDPAAFQYRLARIARLVDEAKDSGLYDDVLLIDGGDLYQGTPVSNLTGGAAVRATFDMMDYDAVALGNHEFDWDAAEYAADSDGTIAPYVLGDYIGDAKTPVLAAGLYDAATGKRVSFTRDYAVIEKAGKRIAVIGYIPDYRNQIMTERIAPYRIDGSLYHLKELCRQVKEKEQPDAVIVLAHEDPAIVASVLDPELAVLVAGGHTHKIAAGQTANGLAYMQGNCNAQGFASAVLVFGPDGVSAENVQYTDIMSDRSLLTDKAENAPGLDTGITELTKALWDAVGSEMSEVLGYIDKPVVSEWDDIGASSGGNFFTGLMLRATQPDGAVAAFYNTGGIRARFTIPDGETRRDITAYDIYVLAPFCNTLLVYEITGAELRQQLIDGLKHPNYGDQMSGLTFTYTATGDENTDRADREYTILDITLSDGTVVDPEDTQTLYRVCTSNYSATKPGSVFENKEPVIPAADAPVDNETFIRLLREEGKENNGHIAVDDGPRGTRIVTPQ